MNMVQASDEKAVIKQLQTLLRTIEKAEGGRVTVPVDGIYGSATKEAVERLQKESGLPVTGEVDADTYAAIYSRALEADFEQSEPLPLYVFPKGRTITAGEVSDLVFVVQVILNALAAGYDDYEPFELNGKYEGGIVSAVRRFQMRNGIRPSGDIDKATWNALVRNYNKYRDVSA